MRKRWKDRIECQIDLHIRRSGHGTAVVCSTRSPANTRRQKQNNRKCLKKWKIKWHDVFCIVYDNDETMSRTRNEGNWCVWVCGVERHPGTSRTSMPQERRSLLIFYSFAFAFFSCFNSFKRRRTKCHDVRLCMCGTNVMENVCTRTEVGILMKI